MQDYARKISLVGGLIFLATTSAGVFGGFTILFRQIQDELHNNLQRSLASRNNTFKEVVDQGWKDSYNFANQPLRIATMEMLDIAPNNRAGREQIQKVVDSSSRFGFSALIFRDSSDREIAHSGTFVSNPELDVVVHTASPSHLLWNNGYVLHSHINVMGEGHAVATMDAERPLSQLKDINDQVYQGGTTDFAICAPATEETMHCFPFRSTGGKVLLNLPNRNNGQLIPMSYALANKTGFIHTKDYRGRDVIAAYAPMGDLGLGTVLKIDADELYQPISSKFKYLFALLMALVAAGMLLLYRQVLPLVRKMATEIDERKKAQAIARNSTRALTTLSDVNRNLVHASNEDELLQAICRVIVNQQGYHMAWVGYLEQDGGKTIRPVAKAGFEEGYLVTAGIVYADTERGRGPTGRAARSGQTQVAQNIQTDASMLLWRAEAAKRGYNSSIALPLSNDDRVFGVLTIYADQANAFSQDETALLKEMAEDLAFGVISLRTRQQRDHAIEQVRDHLAILESNLEDTIKAIATMVEMRDPYTAGHEARVADLAVAIATEMGLPDEQVHGIHLGGMVHDLGKIQIPAEILSMPRRLTEMEYRLVKCHPKAGYDILKDIDFIWPIAQMVLQHHERIDGSGYPQGLKGEAILLEARILCVADVVEAMSSHRPYRPALGIDAAMNEIRKGRGVIYDSAVADACLKLFGEGRFTF